MESRKVRAFVFFVFCAACIVVGQIYRKIGSNALKNSDEVSARIIRITPTRGGSADIDVTYSYKGVTMKNDFSVDKDSFQNGEMVLIKVAKEHPDRYIAFVRKIQ